MEIVTLVPLGVLIVIFGLFPGLILTLIQGTVDTVLVGLGERGSDRVPPRSSDERRSPSHV